MRNAWLRSCQIVLGLLWVLTVSPGWGQPRPKGKAIHWQQLQPSESRIQVGSVQLKHCLTVPAYCGELIRPLDPAGETPGEITIGFEYYPARDPLLPALGTIVATEGGPGYPTTGSRGSYLELFWPLLNQRNLLLVDNRGTGKSGVINCRPLQSTSTLTQENLTLCGLQLGDRSDLYGSALAANDLAAVLKALDTGPVDLYGDSYGTYFSQTFAGLHPDTLRSVILDAAYPVLGLSPWYPENAEAMRNAFNAACQRSVSCRDLPGTSIDRITQLLSALRVNPIVGTAPNGDGTTQAVTADPASLGYAMFSSASGPVIYRELDAAARAYLETQDRAPLLRLIAENQTVASLVPSNPKDYSVGLFSAVSCTDYPQVYDMTAQPSDRVGQRDAAVAQQIATQPNIDAPFSVAEFLKIPLDYSLIDLCLNWPVPSAAHPPSQPVPAGTSFTKAPVLVLSGEFDTLTAPSGGAKAASLFPNSQWIPVANSFHVTALGDQDNCASQLVRSFVSTLNPGNTACAAQIPEIRTVPKFVNTAVQLVPAIATPGNQGTQADLQVAAAATFSVGDVLSRWWVNNDGSGVGLRGGQFSYRGIGNYYRFQLNGLRWVEDVATTGTLDWNYQTGKVVARLQIDGTHSQSGTLTIQWQDRTSNATASISGQIGDRQILATITAP